MPRYSKLLFPITSLNYNCTYISSSTCILHVPLISLPLLWSSWQYLVKCKNHEAPKRAIYPASCKYCLVRSTFSIQHTVFHNTARHLAEAVHTEVLTFYISVGTFIKFTTLETSFEFQGLPIPSILHWKKLSVSQD